MANHTPAHITYANALSTNRGGYGYPLWQPNHAGRGPVELADVGYIFMGNFVRLFNASSGEGIDVPQGYERLDVGQIACLNALPMVPEEIASKGVKRIGGGANLSVG